MRDFLFKGGDRFERRDKETYPGKGIMGSSVQKMGEKSFSIDPPWREWSLML